MTTILNRTILRRAALLFLLLCCQSIAGAQVVIHPSLGLQTFSFLGEPLASQPMSPGTERALPLGGDISSAQAGFRLQAEIMGNKDAILRFPVSVEYWGMNGKTTFSLTTRHATRSQRLTFTHSASVMSANLGITAAFFDKQKVYVSGELKGVYFPATNLHSRIYFADSDETVQESETAPMEEKFRLGGFLRAGAQLPFFDPFLLDFSAGVGILNLGLKGSSNLLVVERRAADEENLQYFSIGMSLIWKL